MFIDEYQHVPAVLDAIKAELNRDLRPGRFVLTGSTRHSSLPLAAQSLTGRLHVITLWPLSQGEIDGVDERFAELLLKEPARLVDAPPSSTTREEYVARILRGGFPLAVARSGGASRNRWFDDYVDVVVERDVADLSSIRQREKMPRLVASLGGQVSQVLNVARIGRDVGLEGSTAEHWLDARVHAGHWRTHDGDEVDLVLERDDGAVAGIEVKAGERVSDADLRGLRKLRDSLGPRFLGGTVLHLGRHGYTHDDRLHALPVDRLWRAVR